MKLKNKEGLTREEKKYIERIMLQMHETKMKIKSESESESMDEDEEEEDNQYDNQGKFKRHLQSNKGLRH